MGWAGGILKDQGRATVAGLQVAEAGSNVTRVTAMGGNASDISGALGEQQGAIARASEGLKKLISDLEPLAGTSSKAAAELQQARNALAEMGASSAEIAHQIASVKSAEAMDIAGTRSAVASSSASIALMSIGRNADVAGIMGGEISAAGNEVATLQGELSRPGLLPEERRAIERNLAGARLTEAQTTKRAFDAVESRPGVLSGLDAGFSASVAGYDAAGIADPVEASNLGFRVAASRQKNAGDLFRRYRAAATDGYHSAEEVATYRDNAASAYEEAQNAQISAGAFRETPAQAARMSLLGSGAERAGRSGGSLASIPYLNSMLSGLDDEAVGAKRVYDNALKNGENPVAARASYESALSDIGSRGTGIMEARSQFRLSTGTAATLDNASFDFERLAASPLQRGTCRTPASRKSARNGARGTRRSTPTT